MSPASIRWDDIFVGCCRLCVPGTIVTYNRDPLISYCWIIGIWELEWYFHKHNQTAKVLSVPGGPHVGPMNLAIAEDLKGGYRALAPMYRLMLNALFYSHRVFPATTGKCAYTIYPIKCLVSAMWRLMATEISAIVGLVDGLLMTTQSHYLNQRWIINEAAWHQPVSQWVSKLLFYVITLEIILKKYYHISQEPVC